MDVDTADVSDADESFLSSRQGNQNNIVLILTAAGLTLAVEHADNRVRRVADTNFFADGINALEKICGDGRPDNCDAVSNVNVMFAEEKPALEFQRLNRDVFGDNARDSRIPIFVTVDDLIAALHGRRDVGDVFNFIFNSFGVVISQSYHGTCRTSHAAAIGTARHNNQHI